MYAPEDTPTTATRPGSMARRGSGGAFVLAQAASSSTAANAAGRAPVA